MIRNRLPFVVAAALIAAAIGDPLVESISNAGIFGGHFADNDHLSVEPTVFVGAIFVLNALVSRILGLFRQAAHPQGNWLTRSVARVTPRSIVRYVPLVIALQLLFVFAMESCEQLAGSGRLLGGLVWLGGPAVFSLATHVALGTICTLVLAWLTEALSKAVVSLVRVAIAIMRLSPRETPAGIAFGRREVAPDRHEHRHVGPVGGRAPPRLVALA